jgi:hypothetical protein
MVKQQINFSKISREQYELITALEECDTLSTHIKTFKSVKEIDSMYLNGYKDLLRSIGERINVITRGSDIQLSQLRNHPELNNMIRLRNKIAHNDEKTLTDKRIFKIIKERLPKVEQKLKSTLLQTFKIDFDKDLKSPISADEKTIAGELRTAIQKGTSLEDVIKKYRPKLGPQLTTEIADAIKHKKIGLNQAANLLRKPRDLQAIKSQLTSFIKSVGKTMGR